MSTPAALAKLVACGLNASGITIEHAELFGVEITTARLSESSGFSESSFECVYAADVGTVIADERLAEKYAVFAKANDAAWLRKKADAWLISTGKKGPYPNLNDYTVPSDWVHAVERFCGFKQGQVFEFIGQNAFSFKPGFEPHKHADSAECLTYSTSVNDLGARGLKFGFVGNEALHESLDSSVPSIDEPPK